MNFQTFERTILADIEDEDKNKTSTFSRIKIDI